ncbi:hypothetical protein T484DRAFT_1804173 [Baffinella frigidus]|nr:hypothetical protein T484DRAFT_1804173 [Cryptophyta sp. CCMP2293]
MGRSGEDKKIGTHLGVFFFGIATLSRSFSPPPARCRGVAVPGGGDKSVGEALGIGIDFEVFPSESVPDDGCAKYNVDRPTSARMWGEHGARWMHYDVVITSDTAAIARTFMEDGAAWLREGGHGGRGGKLVVWVCNRFNYRCEGPDGGDAPRPRPAFPEPEWYALYARAAEGGLGRNVAVVPYNAFEAVWARLHQVPISSAPVKPTGLKSRLNASTLLGGGGSPITVPWPRPELLGGMFFLPARNNDRFMEVQCAMLGLACFRGGERPAASRRQRSDLTGGEGRRTVAAWRQERFSHVLGDEKKIERFSHVLVGVIHIPYAWSTFALFEFAVAGLVTVVPSARFFLELMSHCVAWGAWLCDALETPEGHEGMPGGEDFELWFQDFGHVRFLRDLEDAEWCALNRKP